MAVEMGQGYATAISQVVAETLGIRYEDVNPILADTGATPRQEETWQAVGHPVPLIQLNLRRKR